MKCLRNVGAVKMLIPYLDASDKDLSVTALFGLAYLCDEDESQIFQAKSELIASLLQNMKEAMGNEYKHTEEGFSLGEMTKGT